MTFNLHVLMERIFNELNVGLDNNFKESLVLQRYYF